MDTKRIGALLLVLLEVASFILDIYGQGKWVFLLASFILSCIILSVTIYKTSCVDRGTISRSGILLIVLEIALSVAQLIFSGVCFIMKLLGVDLSIKASVLQLVFAITVFIFTFKENAPQPQNMDVDIDVEMGRR